MSDSRRKSINNLPRFNKLSALVMWEREALAERDAMKRVGQSEAASHLVNMIVAVRMSHRHLLPPPREQSS